MAGEPEVEVPLGVRLALVAGSALVTFALAEGIVRWQDGGTLPQVDRFVRTDWGIALETEVTLRLAGSPPYETRTDADGLRDCGALPPGAGGWVVAGDSQVFGLGVPDAETWCGRMRAAGRRVWPVGVLGDGVEDALRTTEALLERVRPTGVAIVVNDANDWAEAGKPITERYTVLNGWLVRPEDATGLRGAFLASPLSRSHLLLYAVQVMLHDWSKDPRATRFHESPWGVSQDVSIENLSDVIHRFRDTHPSLDIRVLHLPVDFATSQARAEAEMPMEVFGTLRPWEEEPPWNRLASRLDVPVIDAATVLTEPSDFRSRDYHMSGQGHEKLARLLLDALPATTAPAPPASPR